MSERPSKSQTVAETLPESQFTLPREGLWVLAEQPTLRYSLWQTWRFTSQILQGRTCGQVEGLQTAMSPALSSTAECVLHPSQTVQMPRCQAWPFGPHMEWVNSGSQTPHQVGQGFVGLCHNGLPLLFTAASSLFFTGVDPNKY